MNDAKEARAVAERTVPLSVPGLLRSVFSRYIARLTRIHDVINRRASIMEERSERWRSGKHSSADRLLLEQLAYQALESELPHDGKLLRAYDAKLAGLEKARVQLSMRLNVPLRLFDFTACPVLILKDVYSIDGKAYRIARSDFPDALRRSDGYFVFCDNHALPKDDRIGRLSATEHGTEVVWEDEESLAGAPCDVPLPTFDLNEVELDLERRFHRAIQKRSAELWQWKEDLISADIIEVIRQFDAFEYRNDEGDAVAVKVRIFKQWGDLAAEQRYGDICLIVQRAFLGEERAGVAFLEAKKVDFQRRKLRLDLRARKQLRRILSNTNGVMIVYDHQASPPSWCCSTVKISEALHFQGSVDPDRLWKHALPLPYRLVHRYFAGHDLDERVEAVKAAEDHAEHFMGVALIQVAQSDSDYSARLAMEHLSRDHVLRLERAFGISNELEIKHDYGLEQGFEGGRGGLSR